MGTLRFWSIALASGGCVCLAAMAVAASGACVVAPSLNDPPPPARAPLIVHTAVMPAADMVLTQWPDVVIVPVLLGDPSDSYVYSVLVDGHKVFNKGPQQAAPTAFVDGLLTLQIPVPSNTVDLTQCHGIEVFVGDGFGSDPSGTASYSTFGGAGGDTVWWYYVGEGGPGSCSSYAVDAGASATDALIDTLIVTPVEGGGDP